MASIASCELEGTPSIFHLEFLPEKSKTHLRGLPRSSRGGAQACKVNQAMEMNHEGLCKNMELTICILSIRYNVEYPWISHKNMDIVIS